MADLTVSDWAQIAVAGGTAILAIGTFWMARASKDMAQFSKQALALEVEPQFGLKDVYVAFDPDETPGPHGIGIQLQPVLWNPGKVLVHYRVRHLSGSVNEMQGVVLQSGGGVIHPQADVRHFYSTPHIPAPVPSPCIAKLQFSMEYWSVENDVRTMRATIGVTIWPPPRRASPWIYVNGPHYE